MPEVHNSVSACPASSKFCPSSLPPLSLFTQGLVAPGFWELRPGVGAPYSVPDFDLHSYYPYSLPASLLEHAAVPNTPVSPAAISDQPERHITITFVLVALVVPALYTRAVVKSTVVPISGACRRPNPKERTKVRFGCMWKTRTGTKRKKIDGNVGNMYRISARNSHQATTADEQGGSPFDCTISSSHRSDDSDWCRGRKILTYIQQELEQAKALPEPYFGGFPAVYILPYHEYLEIYFLNCCLLPGIDAWAGNSRPMHLPSILKPIFNRVVVGIV
ncbi:hypothetical protein EDD85DRAFT_786808 [Armillaria nabsnona]|nr:hypothetical protein EDD85DRAFT_786808 [Armillaria nabsnona]